jgi:hypothetical protein
MRRTVNIEIDEAAKEAAAAAGEKLSAEHIRKIPTWQAKASNSFFWPMNFLRSMMSNYVIQIAAFGSGAFTQENTERNLYNSLGNIFARSGIDKWIANKTPTTKDHEGNIVVLEGQWDPHTASRINFWWNTGYGFLKNLNLLGLGWVFDVIYYGLSIFTFADFIKENAEDWRDKARKLSGRDQKLRAARASCQTWFLGAPGSISEQRAP